MDCVQVEKAPTASRYNLVENGDFRYATAWSATSGRTTLSPSAAPQLSTNVYQMTGDPNAANRISQTVQVSGSQGDTFILGGWAKGDSAPLKDNRVTAVTANGVRETYTYDTYGRVTQRVTEKVTADSSTTVLTENYTYKKTAAGKETSQVATITAVSAGRTVTYTYTYDANGNILSVKEGTKTTSYTYDSANQLTRENNQAAGKTWVWTYDDAGNILSRKEYAYTTGTLGSVQSTVNYSYGNSSWGDLLTGYGNKTITYEQSGSNTIGNMASDGTWSYTWEHGRELASMTGGGTTWSFTYDADGMRTARTNGSTTYSYVYNGGSLSSMTVGGNTLYFSYDASGTPLSVTYNGTEYYYATNLQGDVVAILDDDGDAVVSYTYDAWGRPLTTTGDLSSTLGTHNPLRYRGYVYDHETSLYYLQSRYYNPTIGRFLNADAFASTGQGLLGNNMFAYCMNNPTNGCDPCGNCFHRLDFWNDCEKCGGKTIEEKWTDVVSWCKEATNQISSAYSQQVMIQELR